MSLFDITSLLTWMKWIGFGDRRRAVMQELIETSERVAAGRYQRTGSRVTERNGFRRSAHS